MSKKIDIYKIRLGIKKDDYLRRETADEAIQRRLAIRSTKYPLRYLSFDKRVYITEEERPHIHIIGSTQEGKSKFMEHLIRDDIERGSGVCLLDPTTGAKTVYDVLKYCCDRGIKKVCLIDPYHRYHPHNRVPGLSPFLYTAEGKPSRKLKAICITDFLDTIRVLFNTDPTFTANIERYLPLVLGAMYDAHLPLRDVRYFSSRVHAAERKMILAKTNEDARLELESVFKNREEYRNYQTTINRLTRFFRDPMGLMFSPAVGINWMKMVSEQWVVLVNLDTGQGFDTLDSRLLGTLVINSIQSSIERLNKIIEEKKPDYKPRPYYLYIDEAFKFANRKLAETLSLKQKTGLKVTISHQHLSQFEDKVVRDAVLANTKITASFRLGMPEDREYMARHLGYGGQIDPEDASFANTDLQKQYSVIKVLKTRPKRIRIPDVREAPVSASQLKDYISEIYQQPWYYDADKLAKENERIDANAAPAGSPSPKKRAVLNRETDGGPTKAKRRSLLDDKE